MWPYLDKAICKMAKKIAAPIITEQIPKYKIDSVEFETLTLGCLLPTFQGLAAHSRPWFLENHINLKVLIFLQCIYLKERFHFHFPRSVTRTFIPHLCNKTCSHIKGMFGM